MNHTGSEVAAEPAATLSIDDLPLPYLEIDTRGVVIRANRAALALHPPEQGELLGQCVFSFLAGGDRETSLQEFASMMEAPDNQPPEVLRYVYDRSGKYVPYTFFRGVMHDAAGNPAGARVLCAKVSEAAEAIEEARRSSLWLESVVDSLHEAVLVADAIGVITNVNRAAEEILGWKAAELVGISFEEGTRMRSFHDADRSPITFSMVLANRCNGLATLADRHGRDIIVRVWASPILDKTTGVVAGVVLLMYRPGAPMMVPG